MAPLPSPTPILPQPAVPPRVGAAPRAAPGYGPGNGYGLAAPALNGGGVAAQPFLGTAPLGAPYGSQSVSGALRTGPGMAGGPHPPASLDALLDSLRTERKLLDDLAATMRRQRTAVGSDDLQTVDDTVFATHRILATLGQARLRRRQLSRLIAGVDEIAMRDLEHVVGPQMTDALRTARDELQLAAGALAREVDVNRRVLRDALASGEAQARVLVGAEVPNGPASYGADGAAAPPPARAGGYVVNRTA